MLPEDSISPLLYQALVSSLKRNNCFLDMMGLRRGLVV